LLLAASPVEDQPAAPKYRPGLLYPAACVPTSGDETRSEQVTVTYSVDKQGRPRGVRVRETTNACVNDAAVAAARGWTFEPRRSGGKAVAQEDLETTFTFKFDEYNEAEVDLDDFDARPIKRVPPRYPSACTRSANPSEFVIVEFDVNAEGATENPRVVDSTNTCLERAAMRAVRNWRYQARTAADKPVARPGVQTAIRFELGGYGVGYQLDDVRPEIRIAIRRISERLGKDNEAMELLAELKAIEAEYGDSFTRMETSLFHQLRGGVRVSLKDHRGALDDLQLSVTLGGAPKDREALYKLIERLEVIVAAEDARAATSPGEAAPDATPDAPASETDGSP